MRTGELETQLALDAELERLEHDEWVQRARFVLSSFCLAGIEFTSDDLRKTMGVEPPSPNVLGALFRSVSDEGWIRFVGYRKSTRPEAHGRPITVWRTAS